MDTKLFLRELEQKLTPETFTRSLSDNSIQQPQESDINYGKEGIALTGEIGSGVALDMATNWMLASPDPFTKAGYVGINLFGGATANYIAQQYRTDEDLAWYDRNWGEVISSGLLGVIPGMGGQAGKFTRFVGKPNTYQRAITSGIGTGVADQFIRKGIDEGRLPTGGEIATGAIIGGVTSPLFKKSFDEVAKIFTKYRGKSATEINKLIEPDEAEHFSKHLSILQRGILEASEAGDMPKVRKLVFEYRKAQEGAYPEYKSYDEFKEITKNKLFRLNDKIEDPGFEIGFTKTDTLSDKQFKQYESFMKAYEYRQSQNEIVRAKVEELESRGMRVSSSDKRKIAGFISLNELEEIAKRNRRPRTDVWKYLSEQVRKEKELTDGLREINEIEGLLNAASIEQFIKNHENELGKKTIQYLRKLQRNVQYPFKRYWNKGHKRSLLELYLADITGGNVASNMIIEREGNLDILLPDGSTFLERGNLGRGAREDTNLYTLVKLQNATWDLEDDFRKTIMPDIYPGEGINPEYEDVAVKLYRIHMDRAAKDLGIKPEFRNLPPNKKALEDYSRSLTDALHVYFRKAEEFDIPEEEIFAREIYEVENSRYEKQFQEMENIFLRMLNLGKRRNIGPFPSKTDDLTQPGRPPGTPKSG